MVQLIVLAAIALFFILKLRSVLGTRDGYEPTEQPQRPEPASHRREFEVIDGGVDEDLTDFVDADSHPYHALKAIKGKDPEFKVGEFLMGAKSAYEMVLTAYHNGDLESVRGFIAPEVAEAFDDAIVERQDRGLTYETQILGIQNVQVHDAALNPATGEAEVSVEFTAQLISALKDEDGIVIEGDDTQARRQRDVWAFVRVLDSEDPNWQLVDTAVV